MVVCQMPYVMLRTKFWLTKIRDVRHAVLIKPRMKPERACQCDSLSYSADGITECQICGDNQVSSEDRTSCMCATDFNDFVNRGMCVQNMDCGNDVATDEGSRCIAFSYIVDDTIEGSGTTEAPYQLAFESTGDLQITVSDSGNDLTYSKTGGSDELQVSRAGVVSFTPESEIASGTYNIVIAAIDETTSAELSLYVNVATPVVVKPDSDLQIDNPAVKAAVIAAGLGINHVYRRERFSSIV